MDKKKILRSGPVYHIISALLWWKCKKNPTTRLSEYKRLVEKKLNLSISMTTIGRIFAGWKWSFKKPAYVQLLKFAPLNIEYYGDYLVWLSSASPSKCKFVDESHFVSKDLYRSLALSDVGERVELVRTGDLKTSLTLTLLTDLQSTDCIYVNINYEMNNQTSFLVFVTNCLASGHLKNGGIFFLFFFLIFTQPFRRAHL